MQRMNMLSMALLALCLFSGTHCSLGEEVESRQPKRRFNPEDYPEMKPPRSDEEREAARQERRERLQAHIDKMKASGDVPTEEVL